MDRKTPFLSLNENHIYLRKQIIRSIKDNHVMMSNQKRI